LSGTLSFAVSATQAYNFYRLVITQLSSTNVNGVNFSEWTLNGTEESLCVTSDAKVGVGIANPQRALEVAGDLVVSGTISGGAGMGAFRNRIINGDMRIAQRGTSNVMAVSAIAVLYGTVDRFGIYSSITSGALTSTQQTLVASDTPFQLGLRYSWRLTTTVPLGLGYFLPTYTVEGLTWADFMWGTSFGQPVTVSFWMRSNIANGSIIPINFRNSATNYSYNAPVTVTNGGGWQYATFTVPPPPNGSTWASDNTACVYLGLGAVHATLYSSTPNTWQASNYMGVPGYTPWWTQAGNYIEFTGVQLEKGTVATPWEQRPYAQELALCQRYYYQVTSPSGASGGPTNPWVGWAWADGASTAQALLQLPVPMRTWANTPSQISASGTVQLINTFSAVTVSSLGMTYTDGSTTQMARFTFGSVTGTLIAGASYGLRLNGSGSTIAVSAEL